MDVDIDIEIIKKYLKMFFKKKKEKWDSGFYNIFKHRIHIKCKYSIHEPAGHNHLHVQPNCCVEHSCIK